MRREFSIGIFGDDKVRPILEWLAEQFPSKRKTIAVMLGSKMRGVQVSVKRVYRQRTLNQNRLYFGWLSIIADELGYLEVEDVHYALKAKLLGTNETKLGVVPKSSRDLETVEFTDYMDAVKTFAATELGLSLPETDEEWSEVK